MDVVILKLGTSSVWQNGTLSKTMLACTELMDTDKRVLIVSSGAVEGGRRCLADLPRSSRSSGSVVYSKQSLAGFGMLEMGNRWARAMAPYQRRPVPLLVTHRNLTDSDERRSIQNVLVEVLRGEDGIVVANENDPVSNEEINHWEQGLGENDKLTEALVRLLGEVRGVRVHAVYFGTAIGGYYAPFPVTSATKLVREITPEDVPSEQMLSFVHPVFSPNKVLQNDMMPKLCAAATCIRHGVQHVGIGKAYDVANFLLRPTRFEGTRFVKKYSDG